MLADRADSRDLGRVYCRGCLSARPDVPLAARGSPRLAVGMTQGQLAERAGLPRSVVGDMEREARTNPGWQLVQPLIEVLGVELVPGRRLTFPPCPDEGPGAVACRECGWTIARGAGSIRTNGPTYCLRCLARHPEATFADRLNRGRQRGPYHPRQIRQGRSRLEGAYGIRGGPGEGRSGCRPRSGRGPEKRPPFDTRVRRPGARGPR
jgi:DNA-binding XRE family transcriptional regulator